jgi:hypothetical protein
VRSPGPIPLDGPGGFFFTSAPSHAPCSQILKCNYRCFSCTSFDFVVPFPSSKIHFDTNPCATDNKSVRPVPGGRSSDLTDLFVQVIKKK